MRSIPSRRPHWIAFNTAHDVTLPGAKPGRLGQLGYFMYPVGETSEGRLDSFDPDTFKYQITAREVN